MEDLMPELELPSVCVAIQDDGRAVSGLHPKLRDAAPDDENEWRGLHIGSVELSARDFDAALTESEKLRVLDDLHSAHGFTEMGASGLSPAAGVPLFRGEGVGAGRRVATNTGEHRLAERALM
jgi:hypothetical protein